MFVGALFGLLVCDMWKTQGSRLVTYFKAPWSFIHGFGYLPALAFWNIRNSEMSSSEAIALWQMKNLEFTILFQSNPHQELFALKTPLFDPYPISLNALTYRIRAYLSCKKIKRSNKRVCVSLRDTSGSEVHRTLKIPQYDGQYRSWNMEISRIALSAIMVEIACQASLFNHSAQ